MNLLTNYDETVKAMVAIEGERWLEQQIDWGENSIAGAMEYAIGKERNGPSTTDAWLHAMRDRFLPGIIYGACGCNRYFVYYDGTVVYSRLQGYATLKQARSLGFKTT